MMRILNTLNQQKRQGVVNNIYCGVFFDETHGTNKEGRVKNRECGFKLRKERDNNHN
ncbi:hypothetical protein HanXRQr2_Chr15g0679131 [Helianthus annuus]|uniref:Uncharacterized protein n=1 Tax=Helianthus annuus TaxID=4232 RepID=A0A9K3DXZ8_HELAN|nr:hypothetical protein HanXRQr2_Chr15g0679131 [Helianthus annuus]